MRKMDEMEWKINLKAIRWSYAFLVTSLVIWGTYNFIVTQKISLPLTLVGLQFFVYFVAATIAKANVEDERGKKQLFVSLCIFCLLLLLGAILYFTIGR